MSQGLVSDQLWVMLKPLIPAPPQAKNGRAGRPRVDAHAALGGILFVTADGTAWKNLSTELGFYSRITRWRRLRAGEEDEVWDDLQHSVLEQLCQDGLSGWS